MGPNTIAVKFEGFYVDSIKDKIKSLPDSKYDPIGKEWLIRKDLMEKTFELIGDQCIENGIKIVEIPDFVYELSKNTVPFS